MKQYQHYKMANEGLGKYQTQNKTDECTMETTEVFTEEDQIVNPAEPPHYFIFPWTSFVSYSRGYP